MMVVQMDGSTDEVVTGGAVGLVMVMDVSVEGEKCS